MNIITLFCKMDDFFLGDYPILTISAVSAVKMVSRVSGENVSKKRWCTNTLAFFLKYCRFP